MKDGTKESMNSLEVRLSHELLDLLGRLMLPPLGVGPPGNNDTYYFDEKGIKRSKYW